MLPISYLAIRAYLKMAIVFKKYFKYDAPKDETTPGYGKYIKIIGNIDEYPTINRKNFLIFLFL